MVAMLQRAANRGRRSEKWSGESKSEEDGRANGQCSSRMVDQHPKQPLDPVIHNTASEPARLERNSSDDCSERHWRNVVLEQMCRSISDDEGGVQVCIREALGHFQEIDQTLNKGSGEENEDRDKS